MTVQLTEAGAEARSIMRWAWQDPHQRAAAALETIHEMAAAATEDELPELQDASTMLSRLVGTLEPPADPPGLGAQLAGPMTIGEQIDLASLHGKHIPGTQFTFRHGWIPLIGPQVNDRYPGWLVQKYPGNSGPHTATPPEVTRKATAAVQAAESPELQAKRNATVISAQDRELTPALQKLARQHAQRIARAQRAAERAASPATPHGPGGSPTTQEESLRSSGAREYVVPLNTGVGGKVAPAPGGVADIIDPTATAIKFPGAIVPRSATPAAPPDTAEEAAGVFSAAAGTAPTPLRQAAVAAGQSLKTSPGTVGAKLQAEDPALASLAAPGASMAALKAYIDARVAAEVARQTGKIAPEQHAHLASRLEQMHRSQQALITHIRRTVQASDDQTNRQDRAHLTMYTLFTIAGVGLAVAGLVFSWPAIAVAMAGAAVPLAQTVHDYVRSE